MTPPRTIRQPRYLQTQEVAELLHVHVKTVARWAKAGLLPHVRTLGGHRRYPAVEIQRLARSLHQPGNEQLRRDHNGGT